MDGEYSSRRKLKFEKGKSPPLYLKINIDFDLNKYMIIYNNMKCWKAKSVPSLSISWLGVPKTCSLAIMCEAKLKDLGFYTTSLLGACKRKQKKRTKFFLKCTLL
jgi:hypothetical protein